jgi:hypothetical protein
MYLYLILRKVKILDISSHCEHKPSIRTHHSNIVNTTVLRPAFKWDLASGGLDCSIKGHDFSTGKRRFEIEVKAVEYDEGDEEESKRGPSQIVNPPFVFSLDFTSNGESVCGRRMIYIYMYIYVCICI